MSNVQTMPSIPQSTLGSTEMPLATPARAPISALDQAMAATLAAITVPSPQNGNLAFIGTKRRTNFSLIDVDQF